VHIDNREERLSKKVRDAQLAHTPFLIVIGDKEANSNDVSYRRYGSEETTVTDLDSFIDLLKETIKSKK
jgi:threonyl-tRNA synthetase